MPETELDALLHECDDRFMLALPEGLPPNATLGIPDSLNLALSLRSGMHIG